MNDEQDRETLYFGALLEVGYIHVPSFIIKGEQPSQGPRVETWHSWEHHRWLLLDWLRKQDMFDVFYETNTDGGRLVNRQVTPKATEWVQDYYKWAHELQKHKDLHTV